MKLVPGSATACIAVTAALACALLLVGCWDGHLTHCVAMLGAGAVAFLVGLRTVRTSRYATLSVGFVIVFWTLLYCGPQAAVIVAALNGLAVVVFPRAGRPLASLVGIYAVASLAVTAWVAGFVYLLAGGEEGSTTVLGMVVPAAAAAGTYHVVNCAFVALIAGLTTRESVWRLFREHFAQSGLSYYAGAGLATLVHVTVEAAGVWPLIAAAPVLYSLQLTLRRLRPPTSAEQA